MLSFQIAVFVVSLFFFSVILVGVVGGVFRDGMNGKGMIVFTLSFFGLVWSVTSFIVGG